MEIIKFKPIDKGFLKAEIDVKLPKWGNFIIRKIKVFEKDGGKWLSFPSEEYEKDGKKQYYQLCLFEDKAMLEMFHKHFFMAFEKYLDDIVKKQQQDQDKWK